MAEAGSSEMPQELSPRHLRKRLLQLGLIVVLVGFLGEAFPYLPQQVTLLNALTIGVPVLLLTLSKAAEGPV